MKKLQMKNDTKVAAKQHTGDLGQLNSRVNPRGAAFSATGRECWFWAGWEPMRHYLRKGQSVVPYFGNGAWLPAWEERKFNGELICKARELGATLLITEFFKGFGRAVEEKNWPILAEFVRECHAQGMKAWGYAQGRSIYYETFGLEVPNWKSWAAHDRDGKLQSWEKTYYRCAPCLNSPDFASYLLATIVDGIESIGWDGIHMDNAFYEFCWCKRCAARFLEFLEERGDFEQLVGFPLSDQVVPPPLPALGDIGLDPLQILWLEFGIETRLRFLSQLRAGVYRRHPNVVLAGNTAYSRIERALLVRGVDPSREFRAFDVLCCENEQLPRIENGKAISQADAHLVAEAGNFGVWVTSWRETRSGVELPPAPGGIWAGMAEEFAHGSLIGNNWALRPAGRGGAFLFEEERDRARAFGEALTFFRRVENAVDVREARTWAELAVLYDPLSAALFGLSETLLIQTFYQYLQRTGIPFRIVFPGQSLPEEVRRMAVFHVGAISEPTRQWIVQFAGRSGCSVWLAGHSGQANEWCVPRDMVDLEDFRSAAGVVHTEAFGCSWQKAFLHPVTDPVLDDDPGKAGSKCRAEEFDAVFNEYFSSGNWAPVLRVNKPNHVLVHSQLNQKGNLLIHLRDQAGSNVPCKQVSVQLAPSLFSGNSARWISPNAQNPTALSRNAKSKFFEIPPFNHYGLLEFCLDK